MYWNGGSAWMLFMPLLWIALIGLIVWAVMSLSRGSASCGHGCGHGHGPHTLERESPEDILDRRLASGEIEPDAYAEARRQLAANRPSTP